MPSSSHPLYDRLHTGLTQLRSCSESALLRSPTWVHRMRRLLNQAAEATAFMAVIHPGEKDLLRTLRRRLLRARKKLSVLRDHDALLETWRRYRADIGTAPARPPRRPSTRTAIHAACAASVPVVTALERWLKAVPAKRAPELERHVLKRYRRARQRADQLSIDAKASRFHHWRKAVRRLMVALDLSCPHPTRKPWIKRLEKLAKILGRERDLLFVERSIAQGKDQGRPRQRLARLRLRLRQRALHLARRLFKRSGKRFLRHLRG